MMPKEKAYASPKVDKSTKPFYWGKPDLFSLCKLHQYYQFACKVERHGKASRIVHRDDYFFCVDNLILGPTVLVLFSSLVQR